MVDPVMEGDTPEVPDTENNKPFKIKDVTRHIKKAVVASTLEEMRTKVAQKFEKVEQLPKIHLDSDGTEVDDEEYFRTLEPNAELIAVFPGEHWIDPAQFVTIASQRRTSDATDSSSTTSTSETERIRKGACCCGRKITDGINLLKVLQEDKVVCSHQYQPEPELESDENSSSSNKF